MIKIYFIRHAATDMSGKGYVAADKDLDLNDYAISECEEMKFKENIFNSVYTSPTKRTIHTAKLLYPYADIKKTSLLSQRVKGELTGHFKDEYDEEYLNKIRNYEIIPKGAESLQEVIKRIDKFFELVISENLEGANVLVVTHNGIMRIISKIYGKLDYYLDCKNLEGFVIEVDKDTKCTKFITK